MSNKTFSFSKGTYWSQWSQTTQFLNSTQANSLAMQKCGRPGKILLPFGLNFEPFIGVLHKKHVILELLKKDGCGIFMKKV
jgi:hypothetical protein